MSDRTALVGLSVRQQTAAIGSDGLRSWAAVAGRSDQQSAEHAGAQRAAIRSVSPAGQRRRQSPFPLERSGSRGERSELARERGPNLFVCFALAPLLPLAAPSEGVDLRWRV